MIRYNIKKSFLEDKNYSFENKIFYVFSNDSTCTKNFHPNKLENIKRSILIKKNFNQNNGTQIPKQALSF